MLLAAAVLHAIWNAIVKSGPDKLLEATLKACGCSLLGLIGILLLPAPAAPAWPFLMGSVGCHLFYYLLLAYAYKGADLGYAYTLMRGSSPLFTAAVAVGVLGETLRPGGWTGVFLLSAGILLLALDSRKRGQFMPGPTITALANALVIMGYTVLDGSGVRHSGHSASYACWVFFLNAFPILTFTLARRGTAILGYARRRWQYGLACGAASVTAYGLSIYAMAIAPIALVAALRETSVIFGMLLGVWRLREKFTPARAASVLLVAAGAVCIKLFA